jgi:hypothetical protein
MICLYAEQIYLVVVEEKSRGGVSGSERAFDHSAHALSPLGKSWYK